MNNKYLFLLLAFLAIGNKPTWSTDLAIGKSAKISGPVNITINQPADLNFKSRDEIFRLRKLEIMKHPELLTDTYTPSNEVFGQVIDKKPWWGLLGEGYYGPGQNSIRGASEESRFILNPYLLAGESGVCGINPSTITEKDIISRKIPMFYQPSNLRWFPKEGKAEITYEISAYKSQMCSLFGYANFDVAPNLSLEAINARDLGLKYFYIPAAWASNINIANPMAKVMLLPQFVHCGGSCGYPGGCNNMSPSFAPLDQLQFTRLPARLVICFWKSAPENGTEKPDLLYTVNYR